MKQLIPLLSLTIFLSTPLSGQIVGGELATKFARNGDQIQDYAGRSVCAIGDIDGDDIDDFMVGLPNAESGGFTDAGRVRIYGGGTGGLIQQWGGPEPDAIFGYAIDSVGDIDNDGTDDFIAGAPNTNPFGRIQAGSIFVISGKAHTTIYRIDGALAGDRFGWSVAGVGDVTQDGVPDFMVGAPLADPFGIADAGSAYVYSGATGLPVYQFNGSGVFDLLGWDVAGAGECTGDGIPDLLVGAPYDDEIGFTDNGLVTMYSGATGLGFTTVSVAQNNANCGWAVDTAGDFDDDGLDEILIGGPGYNGGDGVMFVQSPIPFNTELFAVGSSLEQFGFSVAAAGDIDQDGHDDVIGGAPNADSSGKIDAGSARVYSGATQALLYAYDGTNVSERVGSSVSSMGDINNDGYPEQVTGAPDNSPNGTLQAGTAYVFGWDSFFTMSSTEVSASGGSVTLSANFPTGESNQGFAVLASGTGAGPTSLTGVTVPLTADSIFNQMLTGYTPPPLQGTPGNLNGFGNGTATIVGGPALSGQIGNTYYLAIVSYDPGTLALRLSSVARTLTVVP